MGLGKFRVIAFIMAMPAITDHVNKNIRVELLSVPRCYLYTFHYGFGIVAIHVEYRRLYSCRNRSGIIRTSGVIKICGKSNLIIDNKMDGTTGIVSVQVTHLDNFIHDSLACNRSITMDQDRKN